jgi:hypothetical protein
MAGLSGTGAAATAAVTAAAAEADEEFPLEIAEQVPMGALGSLNIGNVPTWSGYGRARGGLMRAAQPRKRYRRRR